MDEEELDLDKLDNMLEDLDSDDSVDTEDIDTGSRDPITKVLKSTKKVIDEKISLDAGLDIISNTAEKALPEDLRESKESIEKIKDGVLDPIKEEINGLKGTAKVFLENTTNMLGENSLIGGLAASLKNKISDDDGYASGEESEDDKITNNVNGILSNLVDQQQSAEAYRAKVSEMQGKTQEELLARVVSNLDIMKDQELNIVNSYNRKILELDYKKVFLMDKTFNLLKESTELTGKQLEAISKNTGLPDIVKTRSSEHMEKMFKDKVGKAGLDFLSKNSAVSNITNAVKDKASGIISNVAQGLGNGNMLMENGQMLQEAGISTTDMMMGQIVDSLINKGTDKIGKFGMETLLKTSLGKEGSHLVNKLGSDAKYGAEDLKDILSKKEGGINPFMEKLLDFISESAGGTNVSYIDLQSDDPDDATIFDNKAKKSLTTVIPTLLSKILNEVSGIRTGEMPKEEMVYDYYSNKFTNTTKLKREMIHTLNKSNEETAKSLDSSRIFTVFESKNKLTKEERKLVKDKLYKFISKGGTTSPYFLERAGFLDEFKPELSAKLKDNIDMVINDKGRFSQNLLKEFQDALETIKSSANAGISNISNKANKLSQLGRTDILEDLKLTDRNDATKISSDNITEINSKLISKHTTTGVDLDNSNLSRSERTQALAIRKNIEEAVRKVKDRDLQGKVKSTVLKKIRELDIMNFLDLGNVTRNITTLRKFMFDLYKDRLVNKNDKSESWLDEKMPESFKNAKNNFKKGVSEFFEPAERKIKEAINENLGVEEDNKIAVDWDEDTLNNEEKHNDKKHYLKDRKVSSTKNSKSGAPYYSKENGFNCKTCLKDTNDILKDILKAISPKDESAEKNIIDASPIMKKVKNKKLNEELKGLKKFSEGGATDPNKGIHEIAGVVHGKEYVINNKKLNALIKNTKDILSFTKKNKDVKVNNENAFDLFTSSVKDLVKDSKKSFSEVASKISKMSTPKDYEEKMRKQTYADIGKSKIDRQLNKVRNKFGNISPEERITTFIKNVFSKDNKDSIVYTIKNAFDTKNKNSITSTITRAFDTNDKNSIIGKMNTTVEKIMSSVTLPKNLEDGKKMLEDGYETVSNKVGDYYKEGKTFYEDKIKTNSIYKDMVDNNVVEEIENNIKNLDLKMPTRDDIDLSSISSEHAEQIKELGLEGYLKKIFSTESIPEEEEAVPFYTRILTSIDPRGKLLKEFSASGNFLKNMLGLHLSGIKDAGENIVNAGKAVKDFGIKKAKGIGGFIQGLLPPQLRFIFDNTLVGRLTKSISKKFSNIGKGLSKIVTANLNAIKDTAKESFTDKDGNVKINLLRGAKFLGKSFLNTAKATAVGDHNKKFLSLDENESVFGNHIKNIKDSARESFLTKDGNISYNPFNALKFAGKTMYRGIKEDLVKNKNDEGIRGVYKDVGGIGVDVAKTGLSIIGRISGLEAHIPIIRRDLIVEHAPIPERVKSMYFNKEIEFETIKRYIPKKDRKKYYNYLKNFKNEIKKDKKGLLRKTIKKGFEGTVNLAENVVRPGVNNAASGTVGILKNTLGKAASFLGLDEIKKSNKKDDKSDKEGPVSSKLDKLINILKPKKNKFNDKNGDGRRDGSFLDRLKMFGKKDTKDKSKMKTILSKAEDNSGILTAIMMGMGFLLGGVKNFFKDGFLPAMGKIFKNVIWEPIKWLGGHILSGLGNMASTLIKKIPGYDTVKNVATFAKDKISGAGNWLTDKFSKGTNFLKNTFNAVKSKSKNILKKIVSKPTAKKLLELAAKTGDTSKLVGKFLLQAGKRVPLIGMILGGGSAIYHAAKGEFGQAGVDLAAGVASTVPFAGIPLSMAVEHYGSNFVDRYKDSTDVSLDSIKPVNNTDYKTLNKVTTPSDKIKEISARVEKDKQNFIKHNLLTKDNKIKSLNNEEVNSTDILARTIDNKNNNVEKTIKDKNNDSTDGILMKSLSVQTEMLSTLQGIYEMNKLMVEHTIGNDTEERIDKRLEEVDKKDAPKFSDSNITSAFNMKTGTF